jgi:hypothetical protein
MPPAPKKYVDGNTNPVKRTNASPDHGHVWVGAAMVDLTEQKARRVLKYQSYRADDGEKIRVLDVYCSACRKNMEDVATTPCTAREDNQHLIGGDQSRRAKRKRYERPDSVIPMPGPRINRYGIDAVIRGEA